MGRTNPPKIRPPVWNLLKPVRPEEVKSFLKKAKQSDPVPDGVTYAELAPKHLELDFLFNLLLLTSTIPLLFKAARRTALLPKKARPTSPGDYRPIFVSVKARIFFGILATRISSALLISPIQRAFIPADGCANNIILLNSIVYHSKINLRPLCGVFLNVRKAFDSVSHCSLLSLLSRIGISLPLISLILASYEQSFSTVCKSQVYIPRGVKQGDPMSPILFNIILD